MRFISTYKFDIACAYKTYFSLKIEGILRSDLVLVCGVEVICLISNEPELPKCFDGVGRRGLKILEVAYVMLCLGGELHDTLGVKIEGVPAYATVNKDQTNMLNNRTVGIGRRFIKINMLIRILETIAA